MDDKLIGFYVAGVAEGIDPDKLAHLIELMNARDSLWKLLDLFVEPEKDKRDENSQYDEEAWRVKQFIRTLRILDIDPFQLPLSEYREEDYMEVWQVMRILTFTEADHDLSKILQPLYLATFKKKAAWKQAVWGYYQQLAQIPRREYLQGLWGRFVDDNEHPPRRSKSDDDTSGDEPNGSDSDPDLEAA